MMIRLFFFCMILMCSINMSAQNADRLYEEGKRLYDAEKYEQAVPKLQAAADKGHEKAQYRLGRCYDKGYGVRENDKKAFEWYMKAARQDYAKAMYQVGRCYLKGKGVAADRAKATMWFKKAVKDEQDGKEILQELREEASLGDEDAKLILSLIK